MKLISLHPVRADDAAHSPAATGSKDKRLRTHRKKDEVYQVIWARGNFSFGFLPSLMVVTSDYAKRYVLTSLLSLVRGLHFIQCYTVTPVDTGKNHRVTDEIPQQLRLLPEPRTPCSCHREVLLCKAFTCHNQTKVLWSLCQKGYTQLHLGTLKQNLRVKLVQREVNKTFEWSSLLLSVNITLLSFKPGGEIPRDSLEQTLKLPTSHNPSPPSLGFTYSTSFSLGKCYSGYHSWTVIHLAGSWQ